MKKRVIAINLPQFHPFKENDEWWGKGFTEWTNVTKAKPRFRGHYQPHLPSDTGFYDLRLPEARQMQADMAKEAGIYGFCYYHYWFNGKRLMNRPIDEILKSGEPDFPFMLCWANENWSRNWDGGFSKILIEQNYSNEDDINHMKYLCQNVFCDNRYITVDNKPVFVIYKPQLFPDIKKTIETWRSIAADFGFQLYICFMHRSEIDPELYLTKGFDAAIEFQPFCGQYPKWNEGIIPHLHNPLAFLWSKIFKKNNPFNLINSYKEYVNHVVKLKMPSYKIYPGITPGWDNSPRRVNSSFTAFKGSTPELYGKWFANLLRKFDPYSEDENFIFVNAWNEWAEGNHLEPDQRWGKAFLNETRKQLEIYEKEELHNCNSSL